MSLTTSLASFAVVAGLLTITPGLDTALVLRIAARRGTRAGAAAALGISTGVLVWAVAAAVGVSALLVASGTAYTVVRFAGLAYMLWIGVGMLRNAVRGGGHETDAEGPDDAPRSAARSYRQGLLVNLMNPKIGVFYVALLPQFIPPGYPPAEVGVLLALVHVAEGIVWFGGLLLAVDRAARLLRTPKAQRWIDGIAGTAVIGFGLRLARG